MQKTFAYILAFILLLPNLSAESLQAGGYYKSFFTVLNSTSLTESVTQQKSFMVSNQVRLNISYEVTDLLSFSTSYNFSPRWQEGAFFEENRFNAGIDPTSYRLVDLNSQIYPYGDDSIEDFGTFQNLDRAFATISTEIMDVYIGRQTVAWGSGRVLNPTDILAPFTFNELDTEDRFGIDALRIRIPVGTMGEFDTGYVLGKHLDFSKSAFFCRSQSNFMETDASALMMIFRNNFLIGFDFARAVGGAGFWLESAYVFPNILTDENLPSSKYLRTSVGLDYSFSGTIYGFTEYHFSQAGMGNPEDYFSNLIQPAYTDGAVYLMGRHYLALGMVYQIISLINLSVQPLLNLIDRSTSLSAQIEYNVAQDIYLSLGMWIGIGQQSDIVGDNSTAQKLDSEFGGYPDICFSSLRIYF
ncbi:MAG: hypothetical protein VX432_11280 [Candidatus Poribacteria bacterium]|nr:hypothetical protein [Candidatus Poribacteria bacterium]